MVDNVITYIHPNQTKGDVVASFCSTLLQQEKELDSDTENAIKWSANSMYGGESVIFQIMRDDALTLKFSASIDTASLIRLLSLEP